MRLYSQYLEGKAGWMGHDVKAADELVRQKVEKIDAAIQALYKTSQTS